MLEISSTWLDYTGGFNCIKWNIRPNYWMRPCTSVPMQNTKKLCNILSSSEVRFYAENGRFAFLSRLWAA